MSIHSSTQVRLFPPDRRALEVRRCCCWLGKRLRTVNGTTGKRKKMKNTLEVIIKQATRCVRAGCMRAVSALQECRARIRDRFFFVPARCPHRSGPAWLDGATFRHFFVSRNTDADRFGCLSTITALGGRQVPRMVTRGLAAKKCKK